MCYVGYYTLCLRKNVVSNFLRHSVFADVKSVDETTEAAELVA